MSYCSLAFVDIVDRLFVAIFDCLNQKCKKDLEAVRISTHSNRSRKFKECCGSYHHSQWRIQDPRSGGANFLSSVNNNNNYEIKDIYLNYIYVYSIWIKLLCGYMYIIFNVNLQSSSWFYMRLLNMFMILWIF